MKAYICKCIPVQLCTCTYRHGLLARAHLYAAAAVARAHLCAAAAMTMACASPYHTSHSPFRVNGVSCYYQVRQDD